MASSGSAWQRKTTKWRFDPPLKVAFLVTVLVIVLVLTLVWMQFRGAFTPETKLTMIAERSGLSMDPGSKVTYNGVQIGRVDSVSAIDDDGRPAAELHLDVHPRYVDLIPANVEADIKATTVFGSKYVAFSTPENPVPQRITSSDVIRVNGVTTEFDTLFETVVSVAEQVDPIKLNQTLTATAQALDGLGDRFGASLVDGNAILADLNPQMPEIRRDTTLLADLGDVYADAAPDLFNGLDNAVTTAGTLNRQRDDLDRTLMAAVGFGNTGGDVLERGGPYFVRGTNDLIPTSEVLDRNSPSLFCMIRNWHDVAPRFAQFNGGNGYSVNLHNTVQGAPNPWVYPDNLPRVNATGGPEGRPGCWQPVTRELWPAPYLVMDTGASIAPYNHLELGQPLAIEYVWGRQIGENTINP
ncbi:MCE family protein [Mycobacterium sp. PS03-16]|uniref:MCE family protein n=1 Tax=Mycobacterium sp. PS03-16 TaxID=2559611 RepID=UPI001073710E|nr:MCE family protein [Mycobacterium sp. PS03-16]TFV55048.1 MCE family protein [Mycobacterium sp. PS03-16]